MIGGASDFFTIEDVKHLVEKSLSPGKGADIVPLSGGMFNAAFLVTLPERGTLVLKISPPEGVPVMRYEYGIMKGETEAIELAASSGIPVPGIVHSDFSRTLIPADFFFMENLSGTPWNEMSSDLSGKENGIIQEELGRFCALINSIEGPSGYRIFGDQKTHSSWKEAFAEMSLWLFKDAEDFGVDLPISGKEWADLIEMYPEIWALKSPRFVHWDLWEGNIFIDRHESGVPFISGLIDWERALWGDPLIEYCFRSPDPHFLSGYGSNPVDSRAAERRMDFYTMYLQLIQIIEPVPRKYPDMSYTEGISRKLKQNYHDLLKNFISKGV